MKTAQLHLDGTIQEYDELPNATTEQNGKSTGGIKGSTKKELLALGLYDIVEPTLTTSQTLGALYIPTGKDYATYKVVTKPIPTLSTLVASKKAELASIIEEARFKVASASVELLAEKEDAAKNLLSDAAVVKVNKDNTGDLVILKLLLKHADVTKKEKWSLLTKFFIALQKAALSKIIAFETSKDAAGLNAYELRSATLKTLYAEIETLKN